MIPVYKSEAADGLTEIIQDSNSVAYTLPIKVSNEPASQEEKHAIQKLIASESKDDNVSFDLFFVESVLASIGWNKNDDVFDRFETWAARNTPAFKQFNYQHNEDDIIGTLASSKVVDFEGNSIADDTNFEDLPDKFEVVVGSYLWKHWSDENKQERMNKIIAEIGEGKWCVSMECLFPDFDYAVINPEGQHKVIARNEESSFLTKHLRIYGGSGEYQGFQIGRLLRSFAFSGKGLVENPANSRSVILNSAASEFKGTKSNINELQISQEIIMSEVSQEQYDALNKEFAELKAVNDAAVQAGIEAKEAAIAELEAKLDTVSTDLIASVASVEVKDAEITELKETVASKEEEIAKANEELATIEAQAKIASRVSSLVDAGVDKTEAEEIVATFTEASDEMFDSVVALHVEKVEAKKGENPFAKKDDKKKDDKKEDKKDDKADATADEAEAGATDESLEDAKASTDAPLAGDVDTTAETREKTSAFLLDFFKLSQDNK